MLSRKYLKYQLYKLAVRHYNWGEYLYGITKRGLINLKRYTILQKTVKYYMFCINFRNELETAIF